MHGEFYTSYVFRPELNAHLVCRWRTTAFNLEYYTEVQDLGYLAGSLMNDRAGAKYVKLNKVICDLVEDYGLVGFETLAVEVSSESGFQHATCPGQVELTESSVIIRCAAVSG